MFAGSYNTYADYVRQHKEFFPEIYEEDYPEEETEDEEIEEDEEDGNNSNSDN